MTDLTVVVEYALENTELEVIVYQGQLDLICSVVGTRRPTVAFHYTLTCYLPQRLCQYNNN